MVKKSIIFLFILCFSLWLVACGKNIDSSNQTQDSSPSTSITDSSNSSASANVNYTPSQRELLTKATNVIDWQLDNGGWGKNVDTTAPFTSYPSGSWKVGGKYVGTIDNKATYTEMRLLAQAYDISNDKKFKDSFDKAMVFIKNLQYPSGGFSQIYPRNGKYNDYATFNDGAMISVLELLQDIANNNAPFKNIVDDNVRKDCSAMVEKGIDFILKSQLTVQGEKSAWCAQHDPYNYQPMKARNFELASVSGCESVGIIRFLYKQKDNVEAINCAESARKWLVAHRIEHTTYVKDAPPQFFVQSLGNYCWYRFYSLDSGIGFFCTKQGKIYYDMTEFYNADAERATGYVWGGNWLAKAGLNY